VKVWRGYLSDRVFLYKILPHISTQCPSGLGGVNQIANEIMTGQIDIGIGAFRTLLLCIILVCRIATKKPNDQYKARPLQAWTLCWLLGSWFQTWHQSQNLAENLHLLRDGSTSLEKSGKVICNRESAY
jgi:hypothetical protein